MPAETPTVTSSPTNSRGGVLAGVGLAMACQFASYLALRSVALLGDDLKWVSLFWGVPEFFFSIPVVVKLNRQGKDQTAKGLLIMSSLGLVLCCGFAFVLFTVMENLP